MNNSQVTVRVSVGGTNITSPAKFYSTGDAFVGYWTLLVNMDRGSITSLTWDDDPGTNFSSSIS